MAIEKLITDHLDLWTAAVRPKSSAGRGSNSKLELTGIKKLRELILDLAVRGKLVPQNPGDEPASVLLKRIAVEKAQLVKEGKIKKPKALPKISEEEKPFELPEGWKWAKLGSCSADIHYGYTASADYELSEHRLLRITDIQNNAVNWASVPGCEISDEQAQGYLLVDGDILIARTGGTIGKSYLVENINIKSVFASYLIRVRRLESLFASYIKVFLGSNCYWNQLENISMGTGQPNVNGNSLKNLNFPLPPYNEQFRIVTKVDELMALCDQLEQQSEAQLAAHQTLVEALLATLTDSADADELAQNWARLAQHFDTLFTTEASIDALKQTILQLAVMGKLVPQDPTDEPASALLERIAAEKARLVKEKKIKKEKPLPAISEDEKPFELPEGWECIRLGLVTSVKGGKRLPAGHQFSAVATPHIYIRVTDMKGGSINNNDLAYISSSTQKLISNYTISTDDLYVTIAGTIGNVGVVPARFDGMNLTENAAKIILHGVNKLWLKNALGSECSQSQFNEKTNQLAQPKLALHRIESCIILLPPLNEQSRIVAKVDELMSVCDQLKAHLQTSQQTQLALAEALVEGALA